MANQKDLLAGLKRAQPSNPLAAGRKAHTEMIGFILAKVAELTAQQIAKGPEDLAALESYIKTVEHGLGGLRNARDALTRK
jgi:hypothetical protein